MTLGWSPAAVEHGLSRSTLRRLLLQFAPTPADFDRLCIDYAPQVRARFSTSMDRITQTNLLLRLLPPREILAGLAEITGDPTSLQQCLRDLQRRAKRPRVRARSPEPAPGRSPDRARSPALHKC